ncbi:hypothetical protein F5148DRAFT_1284519 [Russula earlei]|uniref:Uncharacterized protein n=1 Tax=Russula earlei TaxID=71964 RepID=A0ACC0U8K8_9AGAM|nr:hypothetical protein F5148DRAFT_1284519 [Russula earlei]
MQRAVIDKAFLSPVSRKCSVYPAIPGLLPRQLHSRGNRPHPYQVSSQALLRAVSSSSGTATSPSTSTLAAATLRPSSHDDDDLSSVIYVGPLTQTFRRLKIFSLSSLALACSLSPFIFIVESSLPSTAPLVAWCGRPYVTTLRRLATAPSSSTGTGTGTGTPSLTSASSTTSDADVPGQEQATHSHSHSHNENAPAGIELTTLTLALSPRATRIYDPAFLGDTMRAFARWELAPRVQLPPEDAGGVRPGTEETVAETLDGAGNVLGRWIVTWGENGEGSCRAQGRIETCVFGLNRRALRSV